MKKLLLCFIVIATTVLEVRSQEVKVDVRAPESCKTGERCIVELVIEKQGIEGFARIQQTLPEGLSAELISDAGSDFIFDKQRVSFIWLSLPPQQLITVSYRIVFNPSVSGTFEITDGSFSYLRDNKIQRQVISPHRMAVNIKAPPVALTERKPDVTQVTENVAAKEPDTLEVIAAAEEEVKEEKPEVKIKPTTSVEEEASVPPKRDTVQALPKKTEESAQPEKVEVIDSQAEARKLPEKAVVSETKKQEDKPVITAKSPEISRVETTTAPVRTAASSGTQYRVQFAALKTQRETEAVKKQFNISEQVFIESDGTWHRYTFGSWNTHAEAEAASKAFVAKNGGNAMVIKYQDGKRMQ